ncbi:MAG TPA: glycosyl hydrolase [Lentisphaeria bacterium]|nr:MAG: hypothetical protein A2X45_22635 [Lentisphaerae bacterium GWF2_50_93]HCE45094.1 glycosyl hydrolase [Lentisphaeria bacterium]
MKLAFLTACVAAFPMVVSAVNADEWKLVWSDEFDKDGLPNSDRWGYEEGFVRNEESQYYTRERLENARVEGGMLVIEGKKEQFKNKDYKAGSKEWKTRNEFAGYTAASLTTYQKFNVKYGRIEAKAKIPQGLGVWPAIWMLGDSRNTGKGWPVCGEIDIMEFVGKEPSKIHGTAHYSKVGKHKSSGGKLVTEKPFDDFHIYAVEWSPEKIDFYFDEQKYHTFNVADADEAGYNAFKEQFYILMNFAIGGQWGGKIDDKILPQKFLIDYVRVYQKTDVPKTDTLKDDAPKADKKE